MKHSNFTIVTPVLGTDYVIMLRTSLGTGGNTRTLVSNFLSDLVALIGTDDIAWTAVNKTGSDLAHLVTKDHTDLDLVGTNTHAQIDSFITAHDPAKFITITPFGSDIDLRILAGTVAFTVPDKMAGLNLTDALISVHTPGTGSGTTNVQVRRRRAGVDEFMLSTAISLDVDDYFEDDGVVDTSYDDLLKGDQIYIDTLDIPTTVPTGLSAVLTFE
jgi:hypothetical protein